MPVDVDKLALSLPVSFDDLGVTIRAQRVTAIAEHHGSHPLGCYSPVEDSILIREDLPRLGEISIFIHEMLHVAERVCGFAVPHAFVAASSLGVTVALARGGLLGADDDEIAAFLDEAKRHGEESEYDINEDCDVIDADREIQRLTEELAAANERVRAARRDGSEACADSYAMGLVDGLNEALQFAIDSCPGGLRRESRGIMSDIEARIASLEFPSEATR